MCSTCLTQAQLTTVTLAWSPCAQEQDAEKRSAVAAQLEELSQVRIHLKQPAARSACIGNYTMTVAASVFVAVAWKQARQSVQREAEAAGLKQRQLEEGLGDAQRELLAIVSQHKEVQQLLLSTRQLFWRTF
eukprot:COSAG05_NODE_398_length_10293_cov_11.919176_6_plen_132_part_00